MIPTPALPGLSISMYGPHPVNTWSLDPPVWSLNPLSYLVFEPPCMVPGPPMYYLVTGPPCMVPCLSPVQPGSWTPPPLILPGPWITRIIWSLDPHLWSLDPPVWSLNPLYVPWTPLYSPRTLYYLVPGPPFMVPEPPVWFLDPLYGP